MESVFLHLLNISITATYIVLAVILLRFLLFKAPRWVSCLLWAVVGLRLMLPFSIESIFSLVPSAEPIPSDIMVSQQPQINTGIGILNSAVNPLIAHSFTPNPAVSANPLQIWILIASIIWIAGLCAMLLWGLISYLRLRLRVTPSLCVGGRVYLCDGIDTPFILGLFRPRIYLPSMLGEEEADLVIAHEKAHLARLDHLWKPLGFLLLAIYWFNPLFWLAYILLCRDIEAACDQRVVSRMSDSDRKNYSHTLLNCSVRRFSISACPLAFGEVGIKSRIKLVLSYKKPTFWIILVSLVLCIALAVCFLTVPNDTEHGQDDPLHGVTDPSLLSYEQQYLMEKHPQYFGLDASKGLDLYVCQFAAESYNFYLFEHSDEVIEFSGLMSTMGISASSMRLILDTYDVTREDITVIPFQHLLSSYIGPHMIHFKDEAPDAIEARMAAYKEKVLDMLFGAAPLTLPVYDTLQFDVDGDGIIEHCILGFGKTSGVFTFTFSAAEVTVGEWEQEYYNLFYLDGWYVPSFVRCEDGVVRVQGIDQNDEIHLFDISIVDGNINLTENGLPVVELETTYRHLTYEYDQHVDFGSKDLSAVDKIVINASGAETEITDPKQIAVLVKAIKTIEGKDPISNLGFSGWHYAIALYCGEEQLFSFTLFADTDHVALTYGLYETVGNHDYPCRYTLTNCSYEDIESVLKTIISEN